MYHSAKAKTTFFKWWSLLDNSHFLFLLHPDRQSRATQLFQEGLQVVVKLIEFGHLALTSDHTFSHLRHLEKNLFPDQCLRLLYWLEGGFGYDFVKVRARPGKPLNIFLVVVLGDSEYHIESFFGIVLWKFKDSPKLIGSKARGSID